MLNSAFALDLATTIYFILFQVIRFPPIKVHYLVVGFLYDGGPPESASELASTCRRSLDLYKRPWPIYTKYHGMDML